MSKQDAKKFLEKREKDPAFKAKLKNAKTQEEVKQILNEANFHFTKEEFAQAFEEKHHRVLTAEELRSINAASKRGHQEKPSHGALGNMQVAFEQ